MKISRRIFSWHHWCGLIVGAFLLLMSITGSILAFADEIEQVEFRNYPTIEPIAGKPSFDTSYFKVKTSYPDWEVRMYHLPKADEALVYELRQKEKSKKIFVHPVSGEVVGTIEDANSSLQRSLLLLHYTLWSGTVGKIIVFFTGCLFLITLVTGFIVYRKSIMKALAFRVFFNRKTTRSFYSSLHRIIGVWSLLFNLLVVATGLWLSGGIALTAIKTPAKIIAAKPDPANITSIDSVVSILHNLHPNYEIHLLRTRAGSNTIGVSGRFTSDPSLYGKFYSTFAFDGHTLEIETSQFMKNLPATEKLKKMAGPLHFGNYGGITVKIIYCLLGLTPGFLSVSGFVIWRKRKRAVKAARK